MGETPRDRWLSAGCPPPLSDPSNLYDSTFRIAFATFCGMHQDAHQNRLYWDHVAELYQAGTRISLTDFHYGPLLPGDAELNLLPSPMKGMRCLEVGCGAGQNSIVLASRGADCTAVDISTAQLECGRALAMETGVTVDFRPADMDALPVADLGRFDLVHSTYALPFSAQPAACIRTLYDLLHPGGTLLLTTAHPIYASEWVTLDSGEEGAVVTNYFEPLRDEREPENGHQGVSSCAVPLSEVFDWLREAGFRVDRLAEPHPLPIRSMTEDEIERRVPYHSASWRDLYDVLSCIPVVAIFRATR